MTTPKDRDNALIAVESKMYVSLFVYEEIWNKYRVKCMKYSKHMHFFSCLMSGDVLCSLFDVVF